MGAPYKEELDGPDIMTVDCDDNCLILFGTRVTLDPLCGRERAEEREDKERSRVKMWGSGNMEMCRTRLVDAAAGSHFLQPTLSGVGPTTLH